MCFGIGIFHYLNNPLNVILSRPRQPIQECPISRKDIAQNLERRSVPSVKHHAVYLVASARLPFWYRVICPSSVRPSRASDESRSVGEDGTDQLGVVDLA